MPVPAAHPFSPRDPQDAALLDAFLAHGLSLPELARAANNPALTTHDVLAWLELPHIAAAIADVRRAHAIAASLRHARARFTAIETLEQLSTTSADPSERRRAATAILAPRPGRKPARQEGLARASRATSRVVTHPRHRPAGAPTDPRALESQTSPNDAPHEPIVAAPLKTPPAADLAIPAPSAVPSVSSLVEHFRDDLEDDLDDRADDDADDLDDEFSDAQLDRFAAEFEQRLGVPITHPDILAAITQGRVHDLDHIAATIRAGAPP